MWHSEWPFCPCFHHVWCNFIDFYHSHCILPEESLSNPFLHLNFSAFLPFLWPFSVLFFVVCTFIWGETKWSMTLTWHSARKRKARWQDCFCTLSANYLTENILLGLSCTEFWLIRIIFACYRHKVQGRDGSYATVIEEMFEKAITLPALQYETFTREKLDLCNKGKPLAPFGNLVKIHVDKKLSMSGSGSYLFPNTNRNEELSESS